MKADQTGRIRYLTPDEEKRLAQALEIRDATRLGRREQANTWRRDRGYTEWPAENPDHLTPIVLLALNTGLRKGEIFELRWPESTSRAQLTVRGDGAKSGQTRYVPLNTEAAAVLTAWRGTTGAGRLRVPRPPTGNGPTRRREKSVAAGGQGGEAHGFRFHDPAHVRQQARDGRRRSEHRARVTRARRHQDDAALRASGAGAQGRGRREACRAMTPQRSHRFSKETIAALTRLLRHHRPSPTIAALQRAVDRYAEAKQTSTEIVRLTRRAHQWAMGLQQRATEMQHYVESLAHTAEAEFFTGSVLGEQERADFIARLEAVARAAEQEVAFQKTRPGNPRLPRFVLNLNVALALKHAGVPLTKSRRSLTHHVFVEVYADLGLSKAGDVFYALTQGVTLVQRGMHFRRRRVRQSHPKIT